MQNAVVRLFLIICLFPLLSSFAGEVFGYTEPYKIVKMSFPEPGVIMEMLVKEGDRVTAGKVLARLDCRVLDRELQISRETSNLRKKRLEQIELLAKESRISPEELSRARADATIEDLKVQRSEAMIENRTLRAPFNGLITEVKKEASESVASPSIHVLTVVQLDKLLLNLYLTAQQASAFHQGRPATVSFIDRQQDVPALVEFISPVTDAASSTIRVKFVISNPGGIYSSGVRCGLPIRVEQRKKWKDED
jgi:RND family efflux transporter MFP subunit